MHVDVLKGPHHGSDRNVEPIFFSRITADHYVFSGNGEHGNPERETLQMLLEERGDEDYTVHLTYPIDEIDVERKEDWEKEQGKEKARKCEEVRANWSPKKNSLAAFLAANKNFAKKVDIVDETEPHLINLLDEIDAATRCQKAQRLNGLGFLSFVIDFVSFTTLNKFLPALNTSLTRRGYGCATKDCALS